MAHSTLFATQAVSKTLRSGASAAWIPRSPRPNTEIQTCCHSLRSSISKHCLQIRNPFWFLRAHTLDPHDAIRDRCFFMLLVRCLAWSSTFLLLVLFLLCRSFTSLVDAHIHIHTHALSVASMTLLPPSSEAGGPVPQSRRCLARLASSTHLWQEIKLHSSRWLAPYKQELPQKNSS